MKCSHTVIGMFHTDGHCHAHKEQNGSVIEPHEDSQEFHEAVLLKHGMTFILQIVKFG